MRPWCVLGIAGAHALCADRRAHGTQLHKFDDISVKLSKIDAEKSKAKDPTDMERIAGVIRKSAGGFIAVNQRVHARLRAWLVAAARQQCAAVRLPQTVLTVSADGADVLKGEGHPDALAATRRLARLLQNQGQMPEALQLLREVLAARRAVLGNEHVDTVTVLNDLGDLLCDGMSDWAGAAALFEEALQLSRSALGDAHGATLGSLSNLARVRGEQGRLAEAEAMLREAVRVHRAGDAALGKGAHTSTLRCINQLANVLHEQGKSHAAEELFQEALAGRTAALGPAHADTLGTANDLANVYLALGQLAQAEQLYSNALSTMRAQHGDDHLSTLAIMHNAGTALMQQGELAKAEQLLAEALRMRRRELGDANPDTLSTMMSMAMLLAEAGRPEEAAPLYQEGLRLRRTTLGATHPDTLLAVSNTAAFMGGQGALEAAEPLFEEAMAGYLELFGRGDCSETHPGLQSSTLNLAILRAMRGDLAGAEPLYREALRLARATPGEATAAMVLRLTGELAGVLVRQGKQAEAIPVLAEALRMRRAAHGDNNKDTQTALLLLAKLHMAQDQPLDAEPLGRELLQTRRAAGAAGVASAGRQLAKCLRARGEADEAAELESTHAHNVGPTE